MKKFQLISSILFIMILAACGQEANPVPGKEGNEVVENGTDKENISDTGGEREEQGASDEVALADFFMKDGTEAVFKGEGNEYAQYTARTQWLSDRFVNVYEDNGGTVMLRTFRIDADKIVVVREEGESYEDYNPSDSELDQLEPKYTYLQLPLNKGANFDGWAVIDDAATLETPLQTFVDVIVVEKKGEEGSINRKYFAKGYGEIKREFIMEEGDGEFKVTSVIEGVK